jgi:hypothetical protein
MDEDCTQPLSSDPKIKLEYHNFSLYLEIPFVESPQVGVSHALHKMITIQNQSRGGTKNTHNNNTHVSKDKSTTIKWQSNRSEMRLNHSQITEQHGRMKVA